MNDYAGDFIVQPSVDELTEDGIALVFARLYQDVLRYCHHTGSWYQWTGKAWRREETKLAFTWARHTCRSVVSNLGATEQKAATLAKAAAAAAVERFAQADRAFAVTSAIWDNDPFLLGTPGGTVDLRSGEMRPASQEDFITCLTAVAPAEVPDCPLWLKFLEQATNGDAALIRFLRAWCGYALTGDTREHSLLFIFGPGGNGKSVFLNTVIGIMAEYCRTAAMETFTASGGDRHPTDLAMLRGARLVTASETEEGRAWAESRIKQMTGGDPVTARFMRQDFFTYTPQFKLTIIGNNKPVLRNVDEAARRRFKLAPFLFKPQPPDRELEQKLRAEWPAILRWMIEGGLDWQRNGLVLPATVTAATADYFDEQDTLRQWIEECCECGAGKEDATRSLFASWQNFAKANGEDIGTAKRFAIALQRMGFVGIRNPGQVRNQRGFHGIRVATITHGGA